MTNAKHKADVAGVSCLFRRTHTAAVWVLPRYAEFLENITTKSSIRDTHNAKEVPISLRQIHATLKGVVKQGEYHGQDLLVRGTLINQHTVSNWFNTCKSVKIS